MTNRRETGRWILAIETRSAFWMRTEVGIVAVCAAVKRAARLGVRLWLTHASDDLPEDWYKALPATNTLALTCAAVPSPRELARVPTAKRRALWDLFDWALDSDMRLRIWPEHEPHAAAVFLAWAREGHLEIRTLRYDRRYVELRLAPSMASHAVMSVYMRSPRRWPILFFGDCYFAVSDWLRGLRHRRSKHRTALPRA